MYNLDEKTWIDLKKELELQLDNWNREAPKNLKVIGNNIFFYGTVDEVINQLKKIKMKFHPDMVEKKFENLKNKDSLMKLSNSITQILNDMSNLAKDDKKFLGKDKEYTVVNDLYATKKAEYNKIHTEEIKLEPTKYTNNSKSDMSDCLEFSEGILRKFVDGKNNQMKYERKIYL